jgi:hypothetical protein
MAAAHSLDLRTTFDQAMRVGTQLEAQLALAALFAMAGDEAGTHWALSIEGPTTQANVPAATVSLPADFVAQLVAPLVQQQVAAYLQTLPTPDPWLTIPEAAAYAKLTEGHMRLLVLGRPYRAAGKGKAERPAVAPRIERGDTGFAKGARVRRSALDAYLTRHKYRQ